jgi:hypothetical protein
VGNACAWLEPWSQLSYTRPDGTAFGVGVDAIAACPLTPKFAVPIFVPIPGNTGHNFSSTQSLERQGGEMDNTLISTAL